MMLPEVSVQLLKDVEDFVATVLLLFALVIIGIFIGLWYLGVLIFGGSKKEAKQSGPKYESRREPKSQPNAEITENPDAVTNLLVTNRVKNKAEELTRLCSEHPTPLQTIHILEEILDREIALAKTVNGAIDAVKPPFL